MEALISAFEHDVKTIPTERFAIYQRGWEGQLGMALIDAVYSKQMKYTTKYGKGLLPRLRAFKASHPQAALDLRNLSVLTEAELQDTLGKGKTNGRSKSSALLEAAQALVGLGVFTAGDYDHHIQAHRDAYLKVYGLGTVTHNYFGMLLGYPNTKPDTWIIGAVQRVANEHGIEVKVDKKVATTILTETYQRTKLGATITHMDHAVWLTERERARL